jgi:hypothetical protein
MRRLATTGFCAVVLLSGCTGGGVGDGPPIMLPCPGKDVKIPDTAIGKSATTVHFVAKGNCKVTKFIFIGNGHDPPPGFTQKTNPPSATILYRYDGKTPIPLAGYVYIYVNDDPQDGNGSGVIK